MVAIKDMAIPSCCGECDFCADNWECILLKKLTNNIVGANAKLSDCPLVEIEERKGKWIRKPIRNNKGGCIGAETICSCCNKDNRHDEYMDYCPNCGSRMIKEE